MSCHADIYQVKKFEHVNLTVSGCLFGYFFFLLNVIFCRCPQLETLSMKRSNMAQAVLNSPLLRDLDLGSCHKLSDAAIRSAATSCPQLESLDMSNCSCVSDETLREIALTCANLHVLNASYCPNVSLEVRF